jgi:hypothetical protein
MWKRDEKLLLAGHAVAVSEFSKDVEDSGISWMIWLHGWYSLKLCFVSDLSLSFWAQLIRTTVRWKDHWSSTKRASTDWVANKAKTLGQCSRPVFAQHTLQQIFFNTFLHSGE